MPAKHALNVSLRASVSRQLSRTQVSLSQHYDLAALVAFNARTFVTMRMPQLAAA